MNGENERPSDVATDSVEPRKNVLKVLLLSRDWLLLAGAACPTQEQEEKTEETVEQVIHLF